MAISASHLLIGQPAAPLKSIDDYDRTGVNVGNSGYYGEFDAMVDKPLSSDDRHYDLMTITSLRSAGLVSRMNRAEPRACDKTIGSYRYRLFYRQYFTPPSFALAKPLSIIIAAGRPISRGRRN